ncbi:hypothetical protein Cme02nite_70490 [Catellatospora methionotrophica]|uniref:DUF1501 domain-containing protein n=1 Tax=Catellatospora methionotrophica TaxID=121620 RepID=A0A8J3LDG5_9ACTN|nr:DUF1501 domain-containing protein [Catellatospora methionotrophica]GIG18717.1 hypothetical protein Cme02nite_70490 [Catellatospora methionotrophica]
MDTTTRRKFLIASGVVGGAALAAGATTLALTDILDTAGDRPEGAKTLVVITLYGGNDGLNTVIPYADTAYQDARPELAYDGGEVLKLDDATGLNPALKGLHELFGNKKLAVVRGVGYPKPDRSHFRSMDIWQTANPDRPGNTGWIGRWLDGVGGDPRLAVSFEKVLPPLLAGQKSAGAVIGAADVKLPKAVTAEALAGFAAPSAGEPPLQARAAACFGDLARVREMSQQVKDADTDADDGDDEKVPATGTGGLAGLQAQLDLVAQCIEAGVATRTFSVSLGGFDTHADERNLQEQLLSYLDKGVTAFYKRITAHPAGKDVVVLVYSEFGRRVKANASDGTDHGTASNVFVLGESIPGGLYGEQPSLTDLDDGDLKFTVDFRDVYASALDRVLQADPGAALDGWKGRLSWW